MENFVEMEFLVHYYEVDYYKQVTPRSLLNYMQETAFLHSATVGDTSEVLAGDQVTWMIYKWFLRIERYPYWKEQIRIRTWISKFKSYKAYREFEIYDRNGMVIATASALCIMVDTVKNTFKKLDQKRIAWYQVLPECATEYDFPNLTITEDGSASRRTFSVRLSDIDSNGHVNNAKYLDWFIEDIPFDVMVSHQMKTLEIIYKKQVTYGQNVTVLSRKTTDIEETSKTFNGEVLDPEGKTCAVMRSSFVQREG